MSNERWLQYVGVDPESDRANLFYKYNKYNAYT